MIKMIFVIIFIISLTGCSYDEQIVMPKSNREICIEKGGVPIMSYWSGNLSRCDFKN